MATVTDTVRNAKQPKGGYLKLSSFDEESFNAIDVDDLAFNIQAYRQKSVSGG